MQEKVFNIYKISANNIIKAISGFLQKGVLNMLDRIALILVTIGALNWGSVGLFKFDLVAWLFGGQAAILSRIVYVLVALAGIWCISLLFRENDMVESRNDMIDDKVE